MHGRIRHALDGFGVTPSVVHRSQRVSRRGIAWLLAGFAAVRSQHWGLLSTGCPRGPFRRIGTAVRVLRSLRFRNPLGIPPNKNVPLFLGNTHVNLGPFEFGTSWCRGCRVMGWWSSFVGQVVICYHGYSQRLRDVAGCEVASRYRAWDVYHHYVFFMKKIPSFEQKLLFRTMKKT